MNEFRSRYLRDRVLTATPAQRVVMLYERLVLDLSKARDATDAIGTGEHLSHAGLIVGELLGSLDPTAGGPADNLSQLYGFLIGELISARTTGRRDGLDTLLSIVTDLHGAFARIAEAGPTAGSPVDDLPKTDALAGTSTWVG